MRNIQYERLVAEYEEKGYSYETASYLAYSNQYDIGMRQADIKRKEEKEATSEY